MEREERLDRSPAFAEYAEALRITAEQVMSVAITPYGDTVVLVVFSDDVDEWQDSLKVVLLCRDREGIYTGIGDIIPVRPEYGDELAARVADML